MQIYCLNDDRGLAGFTHTVWRRKYKEAVPPLRKMGGFDQKGISLKKKGICMILIEKTNNDTSEQILRSEVAKKTKTSCFKKLGATFTKIRLQIDV